MDKSKTPIKTLLWSPRGSGEHYNGPASFTYRLYSSAPKGRIEVTLAHGWPDQEIYQIYKNQHFISDLGSSPIKLVQFIRRGNRWLDCHAREFDVMHSISAFHSSVLPAARAQRSGLPAVIFVSNHRTQLEDKGGLKGVLGLARKRRRLLKEISGFIAMSDAISAELLEYGVPEKKIARIPMGVNTKVFFPSGSDREREASREKFGWQNMPTVIFVGAIVRRKRPDLLVEAIGQLKQRKIDCQLVIVGPDNEPAYTGQMKDRATELNVSDQIIWHGFTRDIAPLFRAADFFSLPSSNEGMAAALIEAMATGLAPIVTPISGSKDVVEDGVSGRIVDPRPDNIADILADYIINPGNASDHGRSAHDRVVNEYSTEVVFSAYESMFGRIISGGSAAE